MPSNLERARSGLRALSVRRDLMAPSSEYPNQFAVRLIRETWKEQPKGLAACRMETQVNHVPAAPALPSLPGTASGWWPLSCLGVQELAPSLCVPGGQLPGRCPCLLGMRVEEVGSAEILCRGSGLLCHRDFGRACVPSHLFWGLVEQCGLVLDLSVNQKMFERVSATRGRSGPSCGGPPLSTATPMSSKVPCGFMSNSLLSPLMLPNVTTALKPLIRHHLHQR